MKTLLAVLLLAAPAAAIPPKIPPIAELKFSPPKGEKHTLKNGITVYLLENRELPMISGRALVRVGTFYDPPGKPGVASLTGATLRSGGSRNYDADKMNETLEYLGARVESGIGAESGSVSFFTLSKHRDVVLPIFADVLKHPAFREDKLKVEKDQALESIRRRNDDPREISRREARRLLYGPSHPYGRRYEASEIKSISRADLVAFHERHFRPRATILALSGDFDSKNMLEALELAFGDWPDKEPAKLPAIPPAPKDTKRVVLIAKDNITQTAFRIVQTSPKRHDPDHFSIELMNDILGGNTFVSRLFTDVRSRKGLAYGVGSFFAEYSESGMFGAACGTRNENAARALKEVLAHIEAMRAAPVLPEEEKISKNSISNSFIFNYQTSAQIIGQRAALDYYGYPPDYLETYLDKVKQVDRAAIQAAAKKWLKPEESLILVVGPTSLKQELESYGTVEVRKPD